MKIGVSLFLQNYRDWDRYEAIERGQAAGPMAVDDPQIFEEDLHLGSLVEPLGFDSLWTVEHHFTPYTMVPDPIQLLSYFAGRTERIEMGTMVIVLPWHDPIRVAEGIAMLDNMLAGRALSVGFGRGLGRREFGALRVPMEESRERFIEALDVIRHALSDEWFSYDGTFTQVPRTTIRPRARTSGAVLSDRFYGAWGSPSSIPVIAETGLRPLFIPQAAWEVLAGQLGQFAEIRSSLGLEAAPPAVAVWVYCAPTEEQAEAGARRYLPAYFDSASRHYELTGSHLTTTKGYEHYGRQSEVMRSGNYDAGQMYLDTQVWGTPEGCLERLGRINDIIGADHVICVMKYGGMPLDEAEASMRLFAREVLPTARGLDTAS
jgi:alkanesulfonate monooxygenase SsuD/methylene tetrahydromethanopterin reductase-like flavin-dependent oxidoreductase (luciferase family)